MKNLLERLLAVFLIVVAAAAGAKADDYAHEQRYKTVLESITDSYVSGVEWVFDDEELRQGNLEWVPVRYSKKKARKLYEKRLNALHAKYNVE